MRLRLITAAAVLAVFAPAVNARQDSPPKRSIDFKVFKADRPATGMWEFDDPITGERQRVELRETGAPDRGLTGVLPDGVEILSLTPKAGGVGYSGSLLRLLKSCGQEKVPISDFLPLGDQAAARLEAKPSEISCPYLENPATARWYVAPTTNPIKLRAAGDITSDRGREQIGLGGRNTGPSTPITADAVLIEGGTEMRYRGKVRSLDGSIWIDVEAMVSPAAGIEPPRGFLPAESLRVAASISFTRPAPPPAPAAP